METLIGLVGKDYVAIAADTHVLHSVVVMHSEYDKIVPVDANKAIGVVGPQGDAAQFTDFLQKNLHLHTMRGDRPMSVHAAASWTRGRLAEALRRGPYQCNMLLGGVDDKGPGLYYIDYMASMHKMPFAAHGYASFFVLSTLDKLYRPDMPLEEGLAVLEKCINVVRGRFLVNAPNYQIKVITATGIEARKVADRRAPEA
eukprot:TRINITY_DN636_c0_g1_i8.p1 TRINITY_DN636_c0_g1~~TRINITY_DN636_c0_g1_i8.p1  ORF type:complete len:230 (-),score=48.90 TRINITY_DN636_c0_g1_i8:242-841(-)